MSNLLTSLAYVVMDKFCPCFVLDDEAKTKKKSEYCHHSTIGRP